MWSYTQVLEREYEINRKIHRQFSLLRLVGLRIDLTRNRDEATNYMQCISIQGSWTDLITDNGEATNYIEYICNTQAVATLTCRMQKKKKRGSKKPSLAGHFYNYTMFCYYLPFLSRAKLPMESS